MMEMSILSVAGLYRISFDMIRSIQKDYLLNKYLKKIKFFENFFRNIATQEVSVGKGHVYLIPVYYLEMTSQFLFMMAKL
jgi:hypothetical protein